MSDNRERLIMFSLWVSESARIFSFAAMATLLIGLDAAPLTWAAVAAIMGVSMVANWVVGGARGDLVTLALVQAAQQFISQPMDVERLRNRSEEFATTVERALEDQDQVKGYVKQLEQKYDSDSDEDEEQETFPEADTDALVAEVEEFLRKGSDQSNNGDPPVD